MKFDSVFNEYFNSLGKGKKVGIPIDLSKTSNVINSIYYIDSGYNYVFNSANLKIIFFKVGYVQIEDKKTKEQNIERFFLIMSDDKVNLYKVKSYSDFNFDVELVDLNISFDVDFNTMSKEQSIDLTNNVKVDMVRRYLELNVVNNIVGDDSYVILDGSLLPYYDFEKNIIKSILSKSSNIIGFSKRTNFNLILDDYSYHPLNFKYLSIKSMLSKIHPKSNYTFRVDYVNDVLDVLKILYDSIDNIFIGYPYGLLLVDKLMKVSEHDNQIISSILYHNCKDKKLFEDLNNQTNAHDFIDLINFS